MTSHCRIWFSEEKNAFRYLGWRCCSLEWWSSCCWRCSYKRGTRRLRRRASTRSGSTGSRDPPALGLSFEIYCVERIVVVAEKVADVKNSKLLCNYFFCTVFSAVTDCRNHIPIAGGICTWDPVDWFCTVHIQSWSIVWIGSVFPPFMLLFTRFKQPWAQSPCPVG